MALTARVRDSESDMAVEQNAVDCMECGVIYTGADAMAMQNEDGDVCPENGSHLGSPMYVAREPLGIPEDDDHAVTTGPNGGTWQYPLEQ